MQFDSELCCKSVHELLRKDDEQQEMGSDEDVVSEMSDFTLNRVADRAFDPPKVRTPVKQSGGICSWLFGARIDKTQSALAEA